MSCIRIFSVLAAISVLISVSSCSSPSTVAQSSTASTIETVTIESTAAPTAKPTPTPTPTPIPTLAAAPYEDLDAEMLMSPEIPGLTKQIQEQSDGINKVVYFTAVDNVYGLKEGLYAGEFKRNIISDDKEVGGIALIPDIAKILMQNEIASIATDEPKICIILPMDITQVGTEDVTVATGSVHDISYVELSCKVPTTIRWIVTDTPFLQIMAAKKPDNSKVDIIVNGLNYQGEDIINFQVEDSSADVTNLNLNNDNLMAFIVLGIPDGYWGSNEVGNNYHGPVEGKTLFGENVYPNGEPTQSLVDIFCYESNTGNAFQISAENLLKAQNCLVFLTASPEQNG